MSSLKSLQEVPIESPGDSLLLRVCAPARSQGNKTRYSKRKKKYFLRIYITISTNTSACPSVSLFVCQMFQNFLRKKFVDNLHNYLNLHGQSILPSRPISSHLQVSLLLEFQWPSQTAVEQERAGLHVFNFKTTWSQFLRASQPAAEQGEAELQILNFKTTWSEFKKPSQTATEQGEANSIAQNVVIDLGR